MDGIGIYSDVISRERCAEIVAEVERVMEGATLSLNREPLTRLDDAVFANHHCSYISQEIHGAMQEPLNDYKGKWPVLQRIPMASYDCKIQRTPAGGGYHLWHSESSNVEHMARVVVWMLYLNDDFDAGETEFVHQQVRVKPQAGTLVLWPAAYTHAHRGNPPYKGTKWVATGWWLHA